MSDEANGETDSWSEGTAETDTDEAAFDAMFPTNTEPPEIGRASRVLEYVTFGYGPYHLLKAVVVQFMILFLDVRLVKYLRQGFATGRKQFATVMWLLASLVFVCILATIVRQMGRRTLAPRFHRPAHLVASVCGYVLISGLSFGFGYATLVVPARGDLALTPALLFPGTLLSLAFAAFIAIGYHAQVDAIDHPHSEDITNAIVRWFDALSWVEPEADTVAREHAYEEFAERSDDLAALLTHATTADGRQLAADFRAWQDRFGAHSMLSREVIVQGNAGDGTLESGRLDSEHDEFRDIQRRLAIVAGLE